MENQQPIEINVHNEEITKAIQDIITLCGGSVEMIEGDLTRQLIQTGLKLMVEGHDTGQHAPSIL